VTSFVQPNRYQLAPYPVGKVLSTAYIIDGLEFTASTFLESKLPDKHASVGFFVQFKHKTWPVIKRNRMVSTVEI
jgi:predicted thioesterase